MPEPIKTLPTTFKCEVFRAGTQTDSAGNSKEWTIEDLNTIADNFNEQDPKDRIDAPATIGHPADNHPAWGWVSKLWVEDDTLWAEFKDCQPQFMELLDKKMFTSRSISLYADSLRLRHVAFLGAAQPAVKGLEEMAFKGSGAILSFAMDGAPAITPTEAAGGKTLDELLAEQEARSKACGISVKESSVGFLVKPVAFASVPDEQFADPVHYRFPFATEGQIRSSMRLFNEWQIREAYAEQERQVILTKLIDAALAAGIDLEKNYMFTEAGNNKGKTVRDERALKFALPVLQGKGFDEVPEKYSELTVDDFADPVNLRFPLGSKFIAATIATWGREDVRKDYTEQQQATISARVIKVALADGYNLTSHAWAIRETYSDHVDVPAEILSKKQLIDVVGRMGGAAPVADQVPTPTSTNYGGSSVNEELFKQFLEELSAYASEAYGEEVATALAAKANELKDKYMQMAASANADPNAQAGAGTAAGVTNNAELAAANKRIAQLEFNERRTGFLSFADGLINEHRILPKHKDQVVGLLEAAHSRGEISFSEGDVVKKTGNESLLRDFLKSLEPQIAVGEQATGNRAGAPQAGGSEFAEAQAEELLADKKITSYREEQAKAGRTLSYLQALSELETQGAI
ncbi:MAG: hypothetical protein JSS89_13265 [Bacteroidetes bacterium]|nr:hypothetical protein [Bacteroidota bacterium]